MLVISLRDNFMFLAHINIVTTLCKHKNKLLEGSKNLETYL